MTIEMKHKSPVELKSNGPEIDRNNPQKSIESAWDRHRQAIKVVNPANKRKYNVIVVGTGLAGASASATLAELGYNILDLLVFKIRLRRCSLDCRPRWNQCCKELPK